MFPHLKWTVPFTCQWDFFCSSSNLFWCVCVLEVEVSGVTFQILKMLSRRKVSRKTDRKGKGHSVYKSRSFENVVLSLSLFHLWVLVSNNHSYMMTAPCLTNPAPSSHAQTHRSWPCLSAKWDEWDFGREITVMWSCHSEPPEEALIFHHINSAGAYSFMHIRNRA